MDAGSSIDKSIKTILIIETIAPETKAYMPNSSQLRAPILSSLDEGLEAKEIFNNEKIFIPLIRSMPIVPHIT